MRAKANGHGIPLQRKTATSLMLLWGVMVFIGCVAPELVPPSQVTPNPNLNTRAVGPTTLSSPLAMTPVLSNPNTTRIPPKPDGTVAMNSTAPIPSSLPLIKAQTPVAQASSAVLPMSSCILTQGYVVSGGDVSPAGLSGGPRRFEYQVKIDTGVLVTVSYRAVPPSPVGDRSSIRLDFHAGEVLIGDYMRACGSFDHSTRALVVLDPGHYIETYPSKQ